MTSFGLARSTFTLDRVRDAEAFEYRGKIISGRDILKTSVAEQRLFECRNCRDVWSIRSGRG
jgi:hypothetical protein